MDNRSLLLSDSPDSEALELPSFSSGGSGISSLEVSHYNDPSRNQRQSLFPNSHPPRRRPPVKASPHLDPHDADVECAEWINKGARSLVGGCCENLCGCCRQCCVSLANVVGAVCGAANTTVVSPIGRSIKSLVLGPNGNDPWELPKNITMIPVNALVVLLEIITRVKKEKIDLLSGDEVRESLSLAVPFSAAIGRLFQALDYIFSFRNYDEKSPNFMSRQDRVKYTAAGLNMLLFASYAALYASMISTMATDASRRGFDIVKIYDPREMIHLLYETSWNAMQIALTGIGSYVVFTNAQVFIRDLFAQKIGQSYRELKGAINADALMRYLKSVEKEDNKDGEFKADDQRQVSHAKGWYFTDVFGRTLEAVLTNALSLIRQPRKNLEGLAFYKPLVNSGAKVMRAVCRSGYQPLSEDAQAASEYHYQLAVYKESYSRIAPSSAVSRFFYKTNWRDDRLEKDLVNHFSASILRYHQSGEVLPPLAAGGAQPADDWQRKVLQDAALVAMLSADLADLSDQEGFSLAAYAQRYNERLYGFYTTGEAQVMRQRMNFAL